MGDLVLGAGGTLEIEIDAANNSDKLVVGGATTVAGALNVTATSALAAFSSTNTYTIITSTGGVSGTFATVGDNLPDLDVVAQVNANSVTLNLTGMSAPTGSSDKSIHPNSVQAAAASDRLFLNVLQQHARNTQGTSSRSSASSTHNTTRQSAESTHENDSAANTGYSAWFAGFGGYRSVDSAPSATGYDASTGGFALGVANSFYQADALISAGLAFGYSASSIKSSPSSAKVDTWHLGLYANMEKNGFLLSGALSFGLQNHDINRVIALAGGGIVAANGKPDGRAFGASLALSYDIAPMLNINQDNNLKIAPLIRFDHVSINRDGFSETGAGILNLNVGGDRFSGNYISLGVEIASKIVVENGAIFRPALDFRWERALGDRNAVSHSTIAGVAGAAFVTPGSMESRNRFVIGAGLGVDISATTSLNIRYDGSFSSTHKEHRASADLTFKF